MPRSNYSSPLILVLFTESEVTGKNGKRLDFTQSDVAEKKVRAELKRRAKTQPARVEVPEEIEQTTHGEKWWRGSLVERRSLAG